ncbi:MAG: SMP-30/gluconolactonase/LRE family protein, partial [Streptosporangiaceae bacterium]
MAPVWQTQQWQVAVPAGAELGERPVWDASAGAMIWVDILAGRLHRFRVAGGGAAGDDEVLVDLGVPIGSAAPRQGGGYVLAAADGFRLTGDGRITRMLTGVTESNGIGWSPDGSTMYYIDSGEKPRRVRAFDYDVISGTIGGERELICYPAEDEYPDGLVVDADGHLWIAFWGGGQVRRYDPAGGLVEVVELPVSRPTCAGFGGPDLDGLYVTSAWEELDAAQRAAEP